MNKRFLILISLIFVASSAFTQKKVRIELSKNKKQSIQKVQTLNNGIRIYKQFSYLDFEQTETKDGDYLQLVAKGLNKSYDQGNPSLPVISRLIEIPNGKKAVIQVLDYNEETINLTKHNLILEILPAQPSHSKSDDPDKIPFIKNQDVYNKDDFFKNDLIKFEDKGYLRNKHLGYIEISPFAYNPVSNQIKVLNDIEIEISFIDDFRAKPINNKSLSSPYFNDISFNTVNTENDTKALIEGPVKYVIVSDPMFEASLQPFIEWKKLKGFNVIEAYTDDTNVGSSTSSIKSYLENLYNNPEDGIAPTFVLFVGDVDQIPAFEGTSGGHITDLYYCEYTGDKLPEVFYGRFSATSVAELQPQIDKTLEVEKYQMPDPSYLDNVVLVAGVDGTYGPTHGNGFVNYANDYYINSDNGITSISYLYPESGSADAEIRSNISAGVAIANYTAHCNSDGWANPSFVNSNVPSMTNAHMYPLMIGNCCLSNKFDDASCFGETLLRAEEKGAVGYIGGSNNTLWDEDYYWGIGLTTPVENPTYEDSELGAYDRFFHLYGEEKNEWYITQGQMIVAGNLAVESSSSTNKTYYWEIYHLMGDPSLTPYVTVPDKLTTSYENEKVIGSNNFEITTEAHAYAAISFNGELLDAKTVDETGTTTLNFDPLNTVGDLILVITKQNRQPHIDTIAVKPSSAPFIAIESFVINDATENDNGIADFGENITLDVSLKNYSDSYDAFLTNAKIRTQDTIITIIDSTESYGSILKASSKTINEAFSLQIDTFVSNNQEILFDLIFNGEDSEGTEYEWTSNAKINVYAPELTIDNIYIDDSFGNDDQLLDPGETADISLIITNNGSSLIDGLNGVLTVLHGDSYLIVNNYETGSFTLDSQQTDTIKFNITADINTPEGTSVYFTFNINDVLYNSYSISKNKELTIGQVQEILISDNDTTISDKAYFYDAGGSNGNYGNSARDTITLMPSEAGKNLQVKFLSFSIEPDGSNCYDYLKIFDGENTDADLIGSYCDSNVPTTIRPTNGSNALTFAFYSDSYVIQSGWKAEVKSYTGFDYQVTLNDANGPVEGVSVEFNDIQIKTNSSGIATFNNIPIGVDYLLKISSEKYQDVNTRVNIFENTSDEFILEDAMYDVTFNLSDEDGKIDGDVTFDGNTLTTSNGVVKFTDVKYDLNKSFLIESFGHYDSTAAVDVNSNKIVNIKLKPITHNIEFIVTDGTSGIQDAIIEFDNTEVLTNSEGVATFNEVKMDTMLTYIIRKSGYTNIENTINVLKDSTVNISMTEGTAYFKVTFTITESSKSSYRAQVIFNEDTLYSDFNGNAVFDHVLESENIPFKVIKNGIGEVNSSLNVSGNISKEVDLLNYLFSVTFNVVDKNDHVLENVQVNFNAQQQFTDANGIAIFNSVSKGENIDFRLSKEGYWDYDSTLSVTNSDVIFNAALSSLTGLNSMTDKHIKIYPNPTTGIFNVEISSSNSVKYKLKVYDVLGSLIYQKNINGFKDIKELIDISDKTKGIYFLSIESESGQISKRILLK